MSQDAWLVTNAALPALFEELDQLFQGIERVRGQICFLDDSSNGHVVAWLADAAAVPALAVPQGGAVIALNGRSFDPDDIVALYQVAPDGGVLVSEDGSVEEIYRATNPALLRAATQAAREGRVADLVRIVRETPMLDRHRLPLKRIAVLARDHREPTLSQLLHEEGVVLYAPAGSLSADDEELDWLAAMEAGEDPADGISHLPIGTVMESWTEPGRQRPWQAVQVEAEIEWALGGDQKAWKQVTYWCGAHAFPSHRYPDTHAMVLDVLLRRFEQATTPEERSMFLAWLKAAYPRAHRERIRAAAKADPQFQGLLELLFGEDRVQPRESE